MRYCIALVIVHIVNIICFCQAYGQDKAPIDSKTFASWPHVADPKITNNGRYCMYTIKNESIGHSVLVIQEIDGTAHFDIPDCTGAEFTRDSRSVVFSKKSDSLGILNFSEFTIQYIAGAGSFEKIEATADEFLLYKLNTSESTLRLRSLITGGEHDFENIKSYFYDNSKNGLLLQSGIENDSASKDRLIWINFASFQRNEIFSGGNVQSVVFDRNNAQFCFSLANCSGNKCFNSLWIYRIGNAKAALLLDSVSSREDSSFSIGDPITFSNDGERLFFTLKKRRTMKSFDKSQVRLNIWTYRDSMLQSQQIRTNFFSNFTYLSVVRISDHHMIRLTGDNDFIAFSYNYKGKYVPISHIEGGYNEENWNVKCQQQFYLVCTEDGKKKQILEKHSPNSIVPYQTSPDGNYLIYYDRVMDDYFSYSILDGQYRNITAGINAPWAWSLSKKNYPFDSPVGGIGGFLEKDTAALIYTKNDIYQVSLVGKYSSIKLTERYGVGHDIVFRLSAMYNAETRLARDETIILNAFDRINKNNGFYSIVVGHKGSLTQLTMQPYTFEGSIESGESETSSAIKAKDSDVYIVQRSNSSESPNYFWTMDFKKFTPLSNTYPERTYNWLTSELFTWKTLEGGSSQGILYKPENFDSRKKYPIIFYYYQTISDALHSYIPPEWSKGPINIPYYVSNGYLVFTPDIHYRIGYTGNSAYNAIVSAARYLSQFHWVDSKRMALQGQSFGGYETDYVIAHTSIFAAACSTSGWADFVRNYGETSNETGSVHQKAYEIGKERLGASLGQRPDLFIANSPIFRVGNISTPLLMMNNDLDDQVPFGQGIELFAALRRLGKKVWMLEYENGDHLLSGFNKKDFTIRQKQFFDFYLKNDLAPAWMIYGRPADKKDVNDGLQLEPSGVKPGLGLLLPEEERKVDSIAHRKLVIAIIK